MLNTVDLVGRLTADPDTKFLTNNTLTTFRLAVERRNRRHGTDFVPITCWNDVAAVANRLTKGRLVAIRGTVHSDEWTTPDGDRRSRLTVLAEHIRPLDAAPSNLVNETEDLVPANATAR